jgi:hypothetical protein
MKTKKKTWYIKKNTISKKHIQLIRFCINSLYYKY